MLLVCNNGKNDLFPIVRHTIWKRCAGWQPLQTVVPVLSFLQRHDGSRARSHVPLIMPEAFTMQAPCSLLHRRICGLDGREGRLLLLLAIILLNNKT